MNNIEFFLQSPICKVEFAGFISDTITLQNQGWQISARQTMTLGPRGIELALYYPAGRLYALTNTIDYSSIINAIQIQWFKDLVFNIRCISNDIQIQLYGGPTTASYFNEFEAVDATPHFTNRIENIKDFKLFKPVTRTNEIIIGPENVSEALDFVLKLQDPKQKEIREKRRKEKARQEYQNLNDSNEEFIAQIIKIG